MQWSIPHNPFRHKVGAGLERRGSGRHRHNPTRLNHLVQAELEQLERELCVIRPVAPVQKVGNKLPKGGGVRTLPLPCLPLEVGQHEIHLSDDSVCSAVDVIQHAKGPGRVACHSGQELEQRRTEFSKWPVPVQGDEADDFSEKSFPPLQLPPLADYQEQEVHPH